MAHSDHGPMILATHNDKLFQKRPYKFEAMWITHHGCEETIKKIWENTVSRFPSFILAQKIKITRNELKKWNNEVFGNLIQEGKI